MTAKHLGLGFFQGDVFFAVFIQVTVFHFSWFNKTNFSALVSSINRQVKGAPRLHASRKPHREQLSEFNYCTLCLLDLTRLCNVCSAPDLQVQDYKWTLIKHRANRHIKLHGCSSYLISALAHYLVLCKNVIIFDYPN